MLSSFAFKGTGSKPDQYVVTPVVETPVVVVGEPSKPSFSLVPTDPDLPSLNEDASCGEIVRVVNNLTDKFLVKCLADHLDTAASLESDDWAANCYMNKKV